jgi:hypothetical protein
MSAISVVLVIFFLFSSVPLLSGVDFCERQSQWRPAVEDQKGSGKFLLW